MIVLQEARLYLLRLARRSIPVVGGTRQLWEVPVLKGVC